MECFEAWGSLEIFGTSRVRLRYVALSIPVVIPATALWYGCYPPSDSIVSRFNLLDPNHRLSLNCLGPIYYNKCAPASHPTRSLIHNSDHIRLTRGSGYHDDLTGALAQSVTMQFAYLARKTSNPPPYTRLSRTSSVRRRQLQLAAVAGCVLLSLIFLVTRIFSTSAERAPPGTPETIIVTLLDRDSMSKDYISKVEENRQAYAARHGQCAVPTGLLLR